MSEHNDEIDRHVDAAQGTQAGAALFATSDTATAPRGRASRAVLGVALALLLIATAAAGAGIGHALWRSSAAGGSSSFFGSGRAAPRSPFAGDAPFGPSDGNGGFAGSPSFGSFGPGSPSSSASGAPANAASIAAKVDPALVDVNSTLGYQNTHGEGTGIVISSSGEVLTNNHVVEGATKITVVDIGNGKTYAATVVGYDTASDVAVLQLTGASGLQSATLGDSSTAKVGEAVVGIGNAGGVGGTPSYAGGSITGLDQSITAGGETDSAPERLTGLIQINAPIEPGDSGGPLVTTDGAVIGMDTAGARGFGFAGGGNGFSSSAFAIPIDTALTIAKAIEAGSASTTVHVGATPFLGVLVTTPGEFGGFGRFGGFGNGGNACGSGRNGVVISSVLSGEPAQAAGLAACDRITSIDGQSVASDTALSKLILSHKPGDTVSLGWVDGSGQSHTTSVALAAGPAA